MWNEEFGIVSGLGLFLCYWFFEGDNKGIFGYMLVFGCEQDFVGIVQEGFIVKCCFWFFGKVFYFVFVLYVMCIGNGCDEDKIIGRFGYGLVF